MADCHLMIEPDADAVIVRDSVLFFVPVFGMAVASCAHHFAFTCEHPPDRLRMPLRAARAH